MKYQKFFNVLLSKIFSFSCVFGLMFEFGLEVLRKLEMVVNE